MRVRAVLAAACIAAGSAVPLSYGADLRPPAPTFAGGNFVGEGFDKCQAPPTSGLRSWLGSGYRAVNIYMGGINRACADQPELSPQWVTTATSNGWALIPTYVGSQAACTTSAKTHTISASTAAAQGTQEADDAAAQMAALGLTGDAAAPTLPVYFDMEPYPVDSSHAKCDNAVLAFFNSWTSELHVQGYLSGIYGTTRSVMKQLVAHAGDATFTQPDDIWYADWSGDASTTGEPGIPDDLWVHHRIHQYQGGHNETFNGNTFNIDNDVIDGDVVAAVTPTPPTGPPYHFAAAPPAGGTLKERSTPETTSTNRTGVTYPSGADLPVVCQAVGETIDGSFVWDQLEDGAYVSDIFTTTTGGLSFTTGVPHCDTTPPVAALGSMPTQTLRGTRQISWSGTDDASGVASYDVRYERARWDGGFSHWHHPADWLATTDTVGDLGLDPGFDYCLEVRATDRSGNVGAWTAPSCVARPLDDAALAAASGWRRLTGRQYFLHTATATHTQGLKLTLPGVQVRRIGIVASVGPRAGSVVVRLGRRTIGTVSLIAAHHAERRLIVLPAFSLRTRTLRLVSSGDGALVRIDGVLLSRT